MTRTGRPFSILFAAIAALAKTGSAAARRAFHRSARVLAAVALIALVAALALPGAAQAQSDGVLVSNIGQLEENVDVGFGMSDSYLLAQGFSVPSGGGNYTLTSIEIVSGEEISSTNIGSLGVSIWSADASGHPASSLYTLTNPASIAVDVPASFTAPADATLEAENTYVVVVYNNRDLFIGPIWRGTTSNDEDATSITGLDPRPIRACGVHLRARVGVAGATPSVSASTAPRRARRRRCPRTQR